MPMGTLTKSTHRQSSRLVSMPPASTPTAAPLAAVADQAPRARRRSPGSVKVVTRMLRVAGARMAPPIPWAARAVISQAPLWASPADQAADGEDGESDDEDAAATEEIGGPSAQHQEAGEGQGVGVDHPLLTGHRQPEALPHLGEGHIDDGHVQHHHELGGTADGQDGPRRYGPKA